MTVTVDPTQLLPGKQKCDWAAFLALDVPSKVAGDTFVQPVGGLTMTLMAGVAQYASGAGSFSEPWGTDQYTYYEVLDDAGNAQLVDLQIVGDHVVRSNVRACPWSSNDLEFTFSKNPATPQRAYYMKNGILRQYNTATGLDETNGIFPKNLVGTGVIGSTDHGQWFWTDVTDSFIIFQQAGVDGMDLFAVNTATGDVLSVTSTEFIALTGVQINEPHYDRTGRYVWITGDDEKQYEWDLVTDQIAASPFHGDHNDTIAGYNVAPDNYTPNQFYYVPSAPVTDGTGHTVLGSAPTGLTQFYAKSDASVGHLAGQWTRGQSANVAERYIVTDSDVPSKVYTDDTTVWTLDADASGEVYSCPIPYSGYYNDAVDMPLDDVWEYGDGVTRPITAVRGQLTQVGAKSGMPRGTFFVSGATLYVRRTDGAKPDVTTHRTLAKGTLQINDGAGLMRLDGLDFRHAAHAYTICVDFFTRDSHNLHPSFYPAIAFGTPSSDGRLLSVNSNMGDTANTPVSFVGVLPTTASASQTADHLALTTEPSASTVSGVAHAVQPAGTVQDSSNATVTSDSSAVTATWVPDAGGVGVAAGTTSVNAVAGAWSFAGTDLHVNAPLGESGHYHFADGSLTGVDSATITITAALASPPIVAYMIYPLGA